MFKLYVVPVQGEPYDHLFEGDSLTLGRASGSDLVLEDRFLSRKHSRIYRSGGELLLEDLGSRNGTLLNSKPVLGPTPLKVGDKIRLSGTIVSLHHPDDPVPSPPAPLPGAPPPGDPPADTPPPGPEPRDLGERRTIFRPASGMLESHATANVGQIRGEDALRRYADRLNLLNEVHRALGRSIDLDELLELILDRAFDHLQPEQGAIFLRGTNSELDLAASRSMPGIPSEYFYSRSLVHEVTEKGLAALVMDVEADERFAASDSILSTGIRSLVAAPLLDAEGTLGMIVLNSKVVVRKFSEEDMELLVSLASVAALSLRNVTLTENAIEHRRLERELALGRRIQEGLLPDHLPEIPGWELYAINVPSRGVSGDYYQVLERDDGRECVLMIADVSGKGIAASLLTHSLEALAAGPIEDGQSPETICTRLSRWLHRRTPPERYATVFLAVLEPATGRARYTNAGHTAGLIVRAAGQAEELGTTGMPIGLVHDAVFEAGDTTLEPGDTLVLYTDGITESENPDCEEYGPERLVELCIEKRRLPLEQLSHAIGEDLEGFAAGQPLADDQTLVLARRLPA